MLPKILLKIDSGVEVDGVGEVVVTVDINAANGEEVVVDEEAEISSSIVDETIVDGSIVLVLVELETNFLNFFSMVVASNVVVLGNSVVDSRSVVVDGVVDGVV